MLLFCYFFSFDHYHFVRNFVIRRDVDVVDDDDVVDDVMVMLLLFCRVKIMSEMVLIGGGMDFDGDY